jgi:putative ABC transport system permease protein
MSRWIGTAAAGTLALALLVGACVFVALAGPALSLHIRSQALHQTLAQVANTDKTVQMSALWSDFTNPNGTSLQGQIQGQIRGQGQELTQDDLAESTSELGGGLTAQHVPLAAGAWASLTTRLFTVVSGAGPRAQAGAMPELEVVYRDPLAGHAQVVAGTYATSVVPAGALGVAVSTQTAARFGLHPGSRLTMAARPSPLHLVVTAIVREHDPSSAFWTLDPTVGAPSFNTPPKAGSYWAGGVFADPGQLGAMQGAFGQFAMTLNWVFPVAVGNVNADQAPGLSDDLSRAVAALPSLTGQFQAAAGTLTVTSPLIADLAAFLATQSAVETVLLLLFVTLAVTGAAVIVLAGRMIVARRDDELGMLRARGGSVHQLAAVMARGALVAAVPGAALGAALAIAVVPGGTAVPSLGWWLVGITVAAALAGPPLIAAWRHRRPAPAVNPALITTAETRGSPMAWRRLVAEVTACAACVAGLVVLHDQGLSADGANLYLSAAPVLVAIPVVLVMLRLYPLAVRGLLALSARGAGATGFVALSGAVRASAVLPAFALVLALGLASFAGMVGDGIGRGEAAAAWQSTGADAVIRQGPASSPVSSAAVREIAAIPGVRQATAVWATSWQTTNGQPVTVLAVDPAGYAALTAGTPFPSFPAAKLGRATGGVGVPVPVLASPAAVAVLGRAVGELFSAASMGPVTVRVAGTLSATPALPGGGAFVVMALRTLPGQNGRPAPNLVLVNGSGIDQARLSAVAIRAIPGSTVTFRTTVLASLAGSPLQHGGVVIVTLTIAAAAAFGLFIVLVGLALGSAERELTLARLVVMGHDRAVGVALAEGMPAVLAAVLASAACAAALPWLVGSAIDLSAFTGTGAPVQLQPGLTALGLPGAVIVLLAVAALVGQTRALRRRSVTGMLRTQ